MPIKRIFLLSIILLVYISPVAVAQITLEGNVEGEGERLSLANISLFSRTDSVTPAATALTDLRGSYRITDLRPGRYTVRINYIGYSEYRSTMALRMPSGGNVIVRDFRLTPDATALSEVTVTAKRNTVYADHTKYTFTDEERAKARFSADLLEHVGDLTVDPISGNLTKLGGGDVPVLINGVNASMADLKSIPADKIRYVEYYTIPSARYSAAAIVNVVTKTLDNGVNGGVDVTQGVTAGFSNGDIFVRGVSGNSQVVINYRLNYRNYKDKVSSIDYTYLLSGKETGYSSLSHAKFGYTTHMPEVKYIYSRPEDISFQVSFKPEYQRRFDNSDSDIHITEGDMSATGTGMTDVKSHYFSPAVDVYFSKNLGEDAEVAANVVTTGYWSKLNSSVSEIYENGAAVSFDDDMYRSNSRQSVIGELFYKKKWGMNSLSLGYKCQFNHSSSKGSSVLSNYELSKYRARSSVNRVYGEYWGQYGRWQYRVGLEGSYISSSNSEASFTKVYMSPQLVVNWKGSENSNIQFNIKTLSTMPTLSQLSNNAEYVTSTLIHSGNPELKSGSGYVNALAYKYNNDLLDLIIGATYTLELDPIVAHYYPTTINGEDFVMVKDFNGKSMTNYGAVISGKIKLLSDKLSLRIITLYLRQRLKDKDNNVFTNNYFPSSVQLSYADKTWGVSYSFNIPSSQIINSAIVKDENTSYLSAYYQYRDFRFTGSCQWFLTKSKYEQRLLDNDLIRHNSRTWINDNRSMVTVGVSWTFSIGKKNEFTKQLNNSDSDKSAF